MSYPTAAISVFVTGTFRAYFYVSSQTTQKFNA